MKLRNLLGVISCLLIAFSGTSYSQSFGPSFSPPPPTNLIITPRIPSTGGLPPGITGTVNTGVNEDDDEKCDLLCARDKGRVEGSELAKRIINQILTQEGIEHEKLLDLLIGYSGAAHRKGVVAVQRIEFSLRRLERRYRKAAGEPDSDAKFKLYNRGKSRAVGKYRDGFVRALAYANVDLLQSRIPK